MKKCCNISQLHLRFTCVRLSYSYLTSIASLFPFPFLPYPLLSKHREAVCNPRLHNDSGSPTAIFYTALNKTRSPYSFTAHLRSAWVTAYAIRYYKKYDLIKGTRDENVKSNNYFHYSNDDAYKLNLIVIGKSIGFTLNEIKQMINAWFDKEFSIEKKISILDDKQLQID